MDNHALVVGIGNTLRGDDALGRVAAQRLDRLVDSTRVHLIEQCSLTPELAADLSAVTLAIFLDAAVEGPAEQAVTRRVSPRAADECMTHRCDPESLLALARRLYGRTPEAYVITFRGRCYDLWKDHLSTEADLGCDLMVREAVRLIGHQEEAERDSDWQPFARSRECTSDH